MIDTGFWNSPEVRALKAPYKLLWSYMNCACDHAGIWTVELDVAALRLGVKLDRQEAEKQFAGMIEDRGEKWLLLSFVEDQYGTLNPANKVHASALQKLDAFRKEGPSQPLASPLQGAKDKDRDKELDKDKESQEGKEHAHEVEIVPDGMSAEMFSSLKTWEQYRVERKLKLTPTGRAALVKKLIGMGDERAIAAIEHSIANGWQGIFEEKTNGSGRQVLSDDEYIKQAAAATFRRFGGR